MQKDSKIISVRVRFPIPGCPGTTCQNPCLSRPLARFWGFPGVPLSQDSSRMSVLVSRGTRKFCPLGNPNPSCTERFVLQAGYNGAFMVCKPQIIMTGIVCYIMIVQYWWALGLWVSANPQTALPMISKVGSYES